MGHSHSHGGTPCGHQGVAELQTSLVAEFQAFAKQQHAEQPKSRQLLQNTSQPATIRISLQYQFSAELPIAAVLAAQLMMSNAVRVIQKFVRVNVPLTQPLAARPSLAQSSLAQPGCSPATIPASLIQGTGAGQPNTDYLLFVTSVFTNATCPGV